MNIRKSVKDDFDIVYDLWKKNRKVFGPVYKSTLDRWVSKGDFYLLFDNDTFIGMCGLHYSKKYKCYSIVALAIKEEYKQKSFGTKLVKFVISDIPEDMKNAQIFASAIEGDSNNKFYDRFCYTLGSNTYKTCTTILYEVDKELLMDL